jgi:hypothetical protein
MNNTNQLIARLFGQNLPTFVAIQGYTNDKAGETANYVINVGASYEKARQRTIQKLTDYLAMPGLTDMYRLAATELLTSATNNANPETASAGSLAQSAAYTNLGRNIKIHNETGELYLTGFVVGKTVQIAGTYKEVKSAEKTLAKKEIAKLLKLPTDKRRNFKFTKLVSVRMQGTTLVFQVTDEAGTDLAPNDNKEVLGN